jgi:membrane protein YqaA with SNARE-associated domain
MQELAEYYGIAQQYLADNTFQEYGILGLFFNSLLSATAIPLPTEILTSALLIGGESELWRIRTLCGNRIDCWFCNWRIN